jgi:hypothetical protein
MYDRLMAAELIGFNNSIDDNFDLNCGIQSFGRLQILTRCLKKSAIEVISKLYEWEFNVFDCVKFSTKYQVSTMSHSL